MGFGVWGVRCGVWGLVFGAECVGFRVEGPRFSPAAAGGKVGKIRLKTEESPASDPLADLPSESGMKFSN